MVKLLFQTKLLNYHLSQNSYRKRGDFLPIPYSKLPIKDLLHHQAVYEQLDKVGRELFPEWDIVGLEKAVLGCGDNHFIYMAEQVMKTPDLFCRLDKDMPFLRFREEGQHYGFELFLSPPQHWYSRGAPLWWAYAARQFTYDRLPMDETLLYEKYKGIAKEFGLLIQGNRYKHFERFAAGGMSSGMVGEQFVREGWYDVRRRNRLYQEPTSQTADLYLDKAKERIEYYLTHYNHIGYELKPEIDSIDFQYSMEDSKMTEHQKSVVTQLWGVFSGKPMTVREMAEQLGVTTRRVYQIERDAIRHLISNKNRNTVIIDTEPLDEY